MMQRQKDKRTVPKTNVPQEADSVPVVTALNSRLRRKTFTAERGTLLIPSLKCPEVIVIPMEQLKRNNLAAHSIRNH